jgi:2-methylcitrate dehydratase PrpD
MSSGRSDSQIIAEFAASFERPMILDDHVEQCGRALADTMAVAIAAQSEPTVRRARQYVDGLAPDSSTDVARTCLVQPAFGG